MNTARGSVQVWAKGFRVTEDSEEFQRVVPLQPAEGFERQVFDQIRFGSLLAPLYEMSQKEVAAQRCIMVSMNELCAVALGRTEDKFRRPSIVMVSVAAPISWDSGWLGEITSCSVSLASRLAAAYAESFRRNPEPVAKQLRADKFLSSRVFNLAEEHPRELFDWDAIMRSIKAWKGVTGVATSKALGFGANVVLGTQHEAELARSASYSVSGYYDVRERQIVSLDDKLVRWRAPAPEAIEPAPTRPHPPLPAAAESHLAEIAATLRRIEGTVARAAEAILDVCKIALRRDDRNRRR